MRGSPALELVTEEGFRGVLQILSRLVHCQKRGSIIRWAESRTV